MERWMRFVLIILGLPKSIYICLRSFPLRQAIHIPILVSPITKIISTKGKISIDKNVKIRPGMIKFGLTGFGLALCKPCVIQNVGHIYFEGDCTFGGGTRINCVGSLEIGASCTFTGECVICAQRYIKIGTEALVSWNTQVMDSDFHNIFCDKVIVNDEKGVVIGNHVWICSNSVILKGTVIGDGCVVGAMTLINKPVVGENSILVGNPARIIKTNIIWNK